MNEDIAQPPADRLPLFDEAPPAELAQPPAAAPDAGSACGAASTAALPPDLAALLHDLPARLDCWEQSLAQLREEVRHLGERLDLVPRQVRQLGSKVDDLTESVSQPRVRDLLGSLLLLYDLLEQMTPPGDGDEARNYCVPRDQVAQTLRLNGVYPIAESGRFDPHIHKAVETVGCLVAEEDGEIAAVYRSGFRTDRTVLRYAEVVVKRCQPPAPATADHDDHTEGEDQA
jgi:molecular chaperone GrpE (heat shock protein)